jgi:hypothetical protein
MAGANLALIDDELMFYQVALLGTTNQYYFDNLVRNRYNTIAASHSIGAGLFNLNSLETISLLKSKIGTKYYYKAVPVNIANEAGDISESTAVGLTLEGWAYRPYRPGSIWLEESGVSARGRSITEDLDLTMAWNLVDKFTGFGRKPNNIPAYGAYSEDEDHTRVVLEMIVGGDVVRQVSTTSSSWTYTEAYNIADNSGFSNEVTFRIYSKSDYGWSRYYQEKTITVV